MFAHKKILLILISTACLTSHSNSFYSFSHKASNFLRYIYTFGFSAATAAQTVIYYRKLRTFQDAPESVTQFCKKRAAFHGLDPEKIFIKVSDGKDQLPLGVFGTHTIIWHPTLIKELQSALENPETEQCQLIQDIYTFLLDHEIDHIKQNCTIKVSGVLALSTAASFCITSYAINSPSLKNYFKEPTNFKEFFIMICAYNLLNMVGANITKNVYAWYAQHQEYGADAYAAAHGTHPEALYAAARYFEKAEAQNISAICDKEADLSSLPGPTQVTLLQIRKLIHLHYSASGATEGIEKWVASQPFWTSLIKNIIDPTHPSGYLRAERIRAVADTLAAAQATA